MAKRLISVILILMMALPLTAAAAAVTGVTPPAADDFGNGVLFTADSHGGDFRNLGSDRDILTDGGNIFEIRVTNTETGDVFRSFCAGVTSLGLAGDGGTGKYCEGYMEAKAYYIGDGYDDLIGALNHINNTLGSIDRWSFDEGYNFYITRLATRIVSQVVIWNLFCGIDIDVMLNGVTLSAWNKAGYHGPEILNALANTDATGDIIGFAYLKCVNDVDGSHKDSCQPQLVPIFKKDPPPVYSGTLSLIKNVNGIAFADWAFTYDGNIDDLISGIRFKLFAVNEDGAYDERAPLGSVSMDELVMTSEALFFNLGDLANGRYVVVEYLTGLADEVFVPVGPLYFNIIGKNGNAYIIEDAGFDYGAFYTIINGWNNQNGCSGARVLNYGTNNEKLNNNGDLFYIGVTNASPGSASNNKEYTSFCANAGSKSFAGESGLGCGGYLVAETGEYGNFVDALNYIEAKYGALKADRDVTTQRAIAQTVVWALLGAVNVNDPLFESTSLSDYEKDAVRDTLANYKGAAINGKIIDIVFMVCEDHAHSFTTCQPQLVPVYDDIKINNRTREKVVFSGSASFQKVVDGEGADPDEFYFALYKKVEGSLVPVTGAKYGASADDGFFHPEFGAVMASNLEIGEYVFIEVLTDSQLADGWESNFPDGLSFSIIEDTPAPLTRTIWADESVGKACGTSFINKKNIPGSLTVEGYATAAAGLKLYYDVRQREMTPYKKMSPAYGTVTATNLSTWEDWSEKPAFDKKNNPLYTYVVPNSNHFTYAKLDKNDLVKGVALVIVEGNKVNKVGTAFVKLVEGNLVITIDDYAKGDWGAVAFTNLKGVPNNGNIHSISKAADMKTLGAASTVTRFDHDNKAMIQCPAGDVIYLYLHSGSMNFLVSNPDDPDGYFWIEGEYKNLEPKVVLDKYFDPINLPVLITVFNAENRIVGVFNNKGTISDLKPGLYKVVYATVDFDPVIEYVEVKAGETAASKMEDKEYRYPQREVKLGTITLDDKIMP